VNRTIAIGEINHLMVERDSDYGLYLKAQNFEEVLLPNSYVIEEEMPIGSIIEVFVYTDSEDRPVATTKYPYAMLGEFGYFTVVDYKQYGAFVNWGLLKDLFVPLSQQKVYFNIGKKYILRVCLDRETGRLYGTQKIGKWLSYKPKGLEKNQKVDIFVISKTPMGYKVVVNNLYEGMLFDNEIFEKISIGDKRVAYIKNIRKDGKLDLTIQPIGKKATQDIFESKVLERLKESSGYLKINSKSSADDIMRLFNMSKKSFKRTLTSLIKQDKVILDNLGIRLKK
jgi:predicted RNA-binding protein (virulence factor B family)